MPLLRTWSARAKTRENADRYLAFFDASLRPALAKIEGFLGAVVSTRSETSGEVGVDVVTRWASMEAVSRFAGPALDAAVVEPEARALLSSFDERVQHREERLAFESPTLAERVAALLVELVPDRPGALSNLKALYATDVVFRDPIQEVRGLAAFVELNERLLRRMNSLSWTIRGTTGNEENGTIEWSMHGAPKFGPKVAVDGMTRLRARDGKVIDHRDYWDLGELVASTIPGGQRILRKVLSPLS